MDFKFCIIFFTLCLLCFGVYSATNFQFIVNGNIEYNAPNVFAEFNTVIYSYPSVTSQEAQTLAQCLKQKGIENIDYPLAHDSEGQAYAYSYRTTQDVIEPEFNNITLDFPNCGGILYCHQYKNFGHEFTKFISCEINQ